MSRAPAVLFDLDGTLLDTTYLHVVAWFAVLSEAGVQQPMSAIHPLIGMGGEDLTRSLLGEPRPDLAAARREYFARFHPLVRALPKAPELVRAVAERGRAVAASSADAEDLEVLLAALGVGDAFSEIVLGKDVERPKPDPGIFLEALDRCGLGPHEAVVVGDAVWDVKAAAAAGITCVALRTGGIDRRDLLDAGAVAVYDDCAALLTDLASSPIGALFA